MTTFPSKPSDFEAIYNADGTCTHWDCGKPGIVLAYDTFSPEVGHWFCAECWEEIEGDIVGVMFEIIEDRRHPTAKAIQAYFDFRAGVQQLETTAGHASEDVKRVSEAIHKMAEEMEEWN